MSSDSIENMSPLSKRPLSKSRRSKVLALSMGQGLTAMVGLISIVVLSRILNKAEYATFRQTFLAYEFALPIMGLGIAQVVYYFLPGEANRPRGRVMDAMCVMLFMGCLFSLFILFGGNELLAKRFTNPQLADSLLYLVPFPLITLPASLLGAVLVVRERVTLLSTFNVLSNIAVGLAVIIPCVFWKTSSAPIIGKVAVAVPSSVIAVYLIFQSVPSNEWRPRWKSIKHMVKYAVPLGLASMIGTITLQLDKVIVSAMCTPEDFAVYANGAIEIPLIGIITGSISAVILADTRKLIVEGKKDEALALFRKAAEKSAWIILPSMVFLFASADLVIPTLFSKKYSGSALPFRFYLGMLPVRIIFFGAMLIAIGKTKIILYRTLVSLPLNLVLSIILLRYLGYIGAIIATLCIVYLWAVPYSIYNIKRYFMCPLNSIFPIYEVGKLLALFLPAGLLIYLSTKANLPAIILLIVGSVFFTFYGLTVSHSWTLIISKAKVLFLENKNIPKKDE